MKKIMTVSALVLMLGLSGNAMAQMPAKGGFQGPSAISGPSKVSDVKNMKDDTQVIMVGKIEKSLGDEKYLFTDASGSITIEIDDDDWNGLTVTPQNTIEVTGEVDKDMFEPVRVDVERVSIKK